MINIDATQTVFIAKTFQGLEHVLAKELSDLGMEVTEIGRRMVSFSGTIESLYKANFHCRTALRILKPIQEFQAKSADDIYEKIRNMEWDKYLDVKKTFCIDSVVYSEDFKHSQFVTYKTKDAIVDYFKDKFGERPSIRINNPDMYIHIHISHNQCTVSLDSSGESLHKRGYRVKQTEAPINEVLAAGLLLLAGWDGQCNFIDPMCGSGTILIEAAMIALHIPPGIYRKEFAFEKWPDFDKDLFEKIYNDEENDREFKYKIYGSDISPLAIEIAEKNISNAGLKKYIELTTKSFQQYTEAPKNVMLITNPPYGERITSQNLLGLYEMIGEKLKHVFMGSNAWIISYRDDCFDKIGLKPSHKLSLMNGSLNCEFRNYEIFAGKYNDYKKDLVKKKRIDKH